MFPELSKISKRRKALGMTQNMLSRKTGISQSLLTKIERGVVVPNYNIACGLFEALEDAEHHGDKHLSDVMHRHIISLSPYDTVSKAIGLAKRRAVSQFPVMRRKNLVGAITISVLMDQKKDVKIGDVMKDPFPTLNGNTPLESAKAILKQYPAIMVLEKGAIAGIVTIEDTL